MKTATDIDDFIKDYPEKTQVILRKIRTLIASEVPDAEETIAYGIPTFRLNGKNLVHFSAYEKHIGFYPTASGITKFKKELAKYKTSRGTVQFPLDEPIPFKLIKKIVDFRAKEVSLNSVG